MEAKASGVQTVGEESILKASSKETSHIASRTSSIPQSTQASGPFDPATQFIAVPPSYMGEQCIGLRAFSTGDSTIPIPEPKGEAKGEGSSSKDLSSSTK